MNGKAAKRLRKLALKKDRILLSAMVKRLGRRLQLVNTVGQLYRLAKKEYVWIKRDL